MKWKLSGYLITAFIILWVVVGVRAAVKDSRAEIVAAFGTAHRIELRLLNYGPGLPCDDELRDTLMSILRTLEPTDYPPRQHCSMVHFIARSSNGREVMVLDMLTTNSDHGLFGMAGEQNYTSDRISSLVRLLRLKHSELGLRFFNAKGRCE